MVASLCAVGFETCHKDVTVYQVVTSIDEMDLFRKFAAILANRLAAMRFEAILD